MFERDKRRARKLRGGKSGEPVHSSEELKLLDEEQNIGLKKLYARVMLAGLAGQVLIADGVFITYAWIGRDWDLPPSAIQSWLAATVVEVVSIVLVITRYLFPDRQGTDRP